MNDKQLDNELKKWNKEFQPTITKIDLDKMFFEHLKNHPELKDEQ